MTDIIPGAKYYDHVTEFAFHVNGVVGDGDDRAVLIEYTDDEALEGTTSYIDYDLFREAPDSDIEITSLPGESE